jgi:HPt (histidine-containing phosphotransfer) domain-containing protein
MNIFKKLFGRAIKKPDIEKLINSENTNGSIIELDDYICKLCEYGSKLDRLNDVQKVFYFNQYLEKEVNNGGFNQFYFNSSGNFAHEIIGSLQTIGAKKTAEIIKKANAQFPNNKVPKDREERQNILEQIEEGANVAWEELDQKFYTYEDDLNSLNMEYIRENKINII